MNSLDDEIRQSAIIGLSDRLNKRCAELNLIKIRFEIDGRPRERFDEDVANIGSIVNDMIATINKLDELNNR